MLESGGVYRGMDGQVHTIAPPDATVGASPYAAMSAALPSSSTSASFNYMSDMSIWDIFRTQGPLLSLLYVPHMQAPLRQRRRVHLCCVGFRTPRIVVAC
jgi:hypothetical protein